MFVQKICEFTVCKKYKNYPTSVSGTIKISRYEIIITNDYHLSTSNAMIIHSDLFLDDLLEETPKWTREHLLLTHLKIFLNTIRKVIDKEYLKFGDKIIENPSDRIISIINKKIEKLKDQNNIFACGFNPDKLFDEEINDFYKTLLYVVYLNFSTSRYKNYY